MRYQIKQNGHTIAQFDHKNEARGYFAKRGGETASTFSHSWSKEDVVFKLELVDTDLVSQGEAGCLHSIELFKMGNANAS